MAGSRKGFTYNDDEGNAYAVSLDESNSEATQAGTQLMPALSSVVTSRLPCGLTMRYANAVLSTDAARRRRFWIGDTDIFNRLNSASTIVESNSTGSTGGTWNVTSKRAEKVNFISSVDTGITDGDS